MKCPDDQGDPEDDELFAWGDPHDRDQMDFDNMGRNDNARHSFPPGETSHSSVTCVRTRDEMDMDLDDGISVS
jgi:hypothetical protein